LQPACRRLAKRLACSDSLGPQGRDVQDTSAGRGGDRLWRGKSGVAIPGNRGARRPRARSSQRTAPEGVQCSLAECRPAGPPASAHLLPGKWRPGRKKAL